MSEQENEPENQPEKGNTALGCIGSIVVLLLLTGLIGSLGNSGPPRPTNTRACVAAQDYVLGVLQAPRTARFESCSSTDVARNGDTWYVAGYVDAQNGFGAMLRSGYLVELSYNYVAADWDLVSVDLLE